MDSIYYGDLVEEFGEIVKKYSKWFLSDLKKYDINRFKIWEIGEKLSYSYSEKEDLEKYNEKFGELLKFEIIEEMFSFCMYWGFLCSVEGLDGFEDSVFGSWWSSGYWENCSYNEKGKEEIREVFGMVWRVVSGKNLYKGDNIE